jgi:hypothetical protein
MRLLSLALTAVFALAARAPQQVDHKPDLYPVLKEQNGLAYVDSYTRVNYIRRATLWQPVDLDQVDARAGRQIVDSRGLSKILPNDSTVECRYVQEELGGTTNKFHCDFIRATDSNNNPVDIKLKKLKVRYNSIKTFSDVITTRLAWILGFGSDSETPVRKVICDGCSRDPFHQKAAVQGEQTFTQVSVETSLPGGEGIYVEETRYSKDENKDTSAWYWDELRYITDPDRKAQSDALKLFAVFLEHGDSKAIQNNLVCLTAFDSFGICDDPFLYVNDFGNTLGSDGTSVHPLDLKKWSTAPLWKDSERCIGSLHMNFRNGSGLSDPEISEAGRKFLADLLSNLIAHESKLREIFDTAHIQDYDDHGHRYSADDWVRAFKTRAALIIDHASCGGR